MSVCINWPAFRVLIICRPAESIMRTENSLNLYSTASKVLLPFQNTRQRIKGHTSIHQTSRTSGKSRGEHIVAA